MKVVHITTTDTGGAGLAAYRLHCSLLSHGIDSQMLVAIKTIEDPSITQAEEDPSRIYHPSKVYLIRKIKKIMRRRGYYLTVYEKIQREMDFLRFSHPSVFYTSPVSTYNLALNPLVQDADIIHLHWVQNFLDYNTFFRLLNKPIIWTLHDTNSFYGGFHHTILKEKYGTDYTHIEDYFYNIKKKSLTTASNISIIAVSKQMHKLIEKHEFYVGKKIYDIYNSVNENKYRPIDRTIARSILNIPIKDTVFLFVSKNLNDNSKGLNSLIKALEKLKINNSTLICLGDGYIPSNTSICIRHFSSVSDSEWMSQLYSAADYSIFPSLEESFLQVAVESLCCGTPVIMTPVGISSELINNKNGIQCKNFTLDALIQGIRIALNMNYDRDSIRRDIINRFGIEKITEEHLYLYNTLIQSK